MKGSEYTGTSCQVRPGFNIVMLILLVVLVPGSECLSLELCGQLYDTDSCSCRCPDFPSIIARVRTAVVNIRADGRSRGTGFIVHPSGRILTNFHVVKGKKQLEVVIDENHIFPAVVTGRDKGMDVALLKINAGKILPFLEMDHADPVVGEWIIVLGNPFGLGVSATVGIVSATDIRLGASPVSWIQVDAAVNPGNSGGPLISMRGKVIGIISSSTTMGQGLGFAVPISEIHDFDKSLPRTE